MRDTISCLLSFQQRMYKEIVHIFMRQIISSTILDRILKEIILNLQNFEYN